MIPAIQTSFLNKSIYAILLSVVSLQVSAQAPVTDESNLIPEQFTPEKYFTDSVSFSYERCYVPVKKKKEERNCKSFKNTARIENNELKIFREFSISSGMYNADHLEYDYGDLNNINFASSTIKLHVEYQSPDGKTVVVTTPPVFYELWLKRKYDKWFGSVNRNLQHREEISEVLYFNTQKDAMEVLKFLENINQLNQSKEVKEPDPIIIDPSPEEIYNMLGITAGRLHEKLIEKGYELIQSDEDTKLYCIYGSCFGINFHTMDDQITDIVYSTLNYSYLTSVKVFCSILIENFDDKSEFRYIWMTPSRDRKIMVKETKNDEGKYQINTAFKLL